MPPVVLHCLVHLTPAQVLEMRFPAVHAIRTSQPQDREHYSLWAMMLWATVPYAVWQLSYHVLITVRRKEKIRAGRPTSFTWLRKTYSKNLIGKAVLALPDYLQEVAFMLIQYCYAVITMIPCPIWFWHRWLSAGFLLVVFSWSIYNGATFYIDVFGKRFQTELEQLKRDVAKWQNSPDISLSPDLTPKTISTTHPMSDTGATTPAPGLTEPSLGLDGILIGGGGGGHKRVSSVDQIPLLDGKDAATTSATTDSGPSTDNVRGRR